MLILEKLLCVIKALGTYIIQRFNISLWLGVSLLLMVYSVPIDWVNARTILCFVFLFCTLFLFRLYDDLYQIKHDKDKPNRDYTNPAVAVILWRITGVIMILLVGISFWIGPAVGLMMVSFMGINHVLYTIFISGKQSAALLPLLKYPFLFFLLQQTMGLQYEPNLGTISHAVALFLAFTIFETMEDPSFPLPYSWFYPLQVVCFLLIGNGCMQLSCIATGLILLAASLTCGYLKWKFAPYVFLLLWLCFKLIIPYEL